MAVILGQITRRKTNGDAMISVESRFLNVSSCPHAGPDELDG